MAGSSKGNTINVRVGAEFRPAGLHSALRCRIEPGGGPRASTDAYSLNGRVGPECGVCVVQHAATSILTCRFCIQIFGVRNDGIERGEEQQAGKETADMRLPSNLLPRLGCERHCSEPE